MIPLLPPLPAGDWNEATISRDLVSRQPYFENSLKRSLPGVTSVWHPKRVDYLDLKLGQKWKSAVYETTIQSSTEYFVKFARFDWEIEAVNHETAAYQWLEGQRIGPAFLGHVTEHGRVIGFLMEKVTDARRADPQDIGACQTALAKLHSLGIKHGDVNRHNFLVRDGEVILIDFDFARKCEDKNELEQEMESLPEQLSDTSGRGGMITLSG